MDSFSRTVNLHVAVMVTRNSTYTADWTSLYILDPELRILNLTLKVRTNQTVEFFGNADITTRLGNSGLFPFDTYWTYVRLAFDPSFNFNRSAPTLNSMPLGRKGWVASALINPILNNWTVQIEYNFSRPLWQLIPYLLPSGLTLLILGATMTITGKSDKEKKEAFTTRLAVYPSLILWGLGFHFTLQSSVPPGRAFLSIAEIVNMVGVLAIAVSLIFTTASRAHLSTEWKLNAWGTGVTATFTVLLFCPILLTLSFPTVTAAIACSICPLLTPLIVASAYTYSIESNQPKKPAKDPAPKLTPDAKRGPSTRESGSRKAK